LLGACSNSGSEADAMTAFDASVDRGEWTLTGSVGGIPLQASTQSVAATYNQASLPVRTIVTLSPMDDYCSQSAGDPCPGPGDTRWQFEIIIRGTEVGTYVIDPNGSTMPASGRVSVFLLLLEENCALASPDVRATSGTVTFSRIDLQPGGGVDLALDIATADGSLTGPVSAPFCAR
jgi:hypothetical protein